MPGLSDIYFLNRLHILMVLKMGKKHSYCFLEKYMIIILCYCIIIVRVKKYDSAVDVRNVSENVGAEILNNLNSGENMLAERLPLNFVLIEFKLLLAEKR
jgi:hypothetical protein